MNGQDLVGKTVTVKTWDGRFYDAEVINYEDDIKNGRPGVDLDVGRWCYLDQITKVEGYYAAF